MNRRDDYHHEMPRDRLLDDQTVEALIAGRVTSRTVELGDLAQVLGDVRALASCSLPTPSPQLAAILSGGLTSQGALPATAATKVIELAPPVPGEPKRKKKMFQTLAGNAMVKVAAVVAGLTITTGAAAAADVLPQVAQDKLAAAIELVLPVDIPDSADTAKAKRSEAEKVAEEHKVEVEEHQDGSDAADQGGFGQSVSGDATSGLPQQDAPSFGENVANTAPKAPQATTATTAETPTATNNPGSSYRDSPPTTQPAETPTAEDNPGASHRESAPTSEPEAPTADDNPGGSYRESGPEAGRAFRP